MRILVTGAKGFVGKNLISELYNRGYYDVYEYDIDTPERELNAFCRKCDFVFHLAGVNRPKEETEFMEGNAGFTDTVLKKIRERGAKTPVLLASTIKSGQDTPYGRSKKAAEDLVNQYGDETGARVIVFRFSNLFGKWCRPNYNSVVATFCYRIARGEDITIDDPAAEVPLVYIEDAVDAMIRAMESKKEPEKPCLVAKPIYYVRVGELAEKIRSFYKARHDSVIPDMADDFTRKLYATYLTYLPKSGFSTALNQHADERGSFCELLHTAERGQVSVNVIKPGIVKGNHWHHTKNEKFIVVSGQGVIRLRDIFEEDTTVYLVSGDKPEVVDIPPGYTHNIENTGSIDLIAIMWANENFNPDAQDTYPLPV